MNTTAQTQAEADLENAVAILWREHDRLVALVMGAFDLMQHAQEMGKPLNLPVLRPAAAEQLRQSIAARDEVLAPFGIVDGEVKS